MVLDLTAFVEPLFPEVDSTFVIPIANRSGTQYPIGGNKTPEEVVCVPICVSPYALKSKPLTVHPELSYNGARGEVMQVKVPEDTQQLSVAAGFADVDQFVNSLLRKERERLAIQAGIDAMDAGQVVDFADFDREFREKNGLKSR